jgi:hypothetical protein
MRPSKRGREVERAPLLRSYGESHCSYEYDLHPTSAEKNHAQQMQKDVG